MSLRFVENDLNSVNGLVQLDATGKMPIIDGSNLTGIASAPAVLANNFDAYQVVIQSTDTTAENGKLYMITANCIIDFPNGTDNGERIGFLIVDNGINLTLRAQGGSTGTARRFCVNGQCWSSTAGAADTTMGPVSVSTQTYSGKGKCLEFVRHYDGIRTGWIEKSHQQFFDISGGTTINGNWGNFDNVLGTNAATGYTRYTMVNDGVDWRWRTLSQDVTALSGAAGTTITATLPANHQYMDYIIYTVACSTTTWTNIVTINLTNLSSLAKDQIHFKPIIFLLGDNKQIAAANPCNSTYPYYQVAFSDTTVGSNFQQKFDAVTSPNAPHTYVSAVGLEHGARSTSAATYNANLGVIIAYNKDTQKWYILNTLAKKG